MLGPFPIHAIPNAQISRIGVIPKKSSSKWRLITDLSFPPRYSVNDGIDPTLTTLSYISVDTVAQKVALLGAGSLMAKADIQEAYRLVPIHTDDKHLLGLSWQDQLFIDIALPFGLRSAPLIFTALADGLQWILQQNGMSYVEHYLDDFITVGPPGSDQCLQNQQILTATCETLGIPLAPRKSVGPTTCLTFLGIEIDSIAAELRLPQEKLTKLKDLLTEWQQKKVCSREQLESLLGHLNHACKVVTPGRSFISRLISLLTDAKKKHRYMSRLNEDARSDLRWWHTFIESWNGVTILHTQSREHPDHEIWSDASGSWGAGALWQTEWFQVRWPQSLSYENIAAKELIPITMACAIWGAQWSGLTIKVHCDNKAVVDLINSGYTRETLLSHLLRCLFFFVARFDFTLVASHIPGKDNVLADALSRDNLQFFLSESPQANRQPTEIPPHLLDILAVEMPDWTSSAWTLWFHTTFKHP